MMYLWSVATDLFRLSYLDEVQSSKIFQYRLHAYIKGTIPRNHEIFVNLPCSFISHAKVTFRNVSRTIFARRH